MYRLKMVPPVYSKDPAFVESPIGTGPYKFDKWDRGSQVTLTRNDDYWGDKPPIKDVTLRFISEAGTRAGGPEDRRDPARHAAPAGADQGRPAGHHPRWPRVPGVPAQELRGHARRTP